MGVLVCHRSSFSRQTSVSVLKYPRKAVHITYIAQLRIYFQIPSCFFLKGCILDHCYTFASSANSLLGLPWQHTGKWKECFVHHVAWSPFLKLLTYKNWHPPMWRSCWFCVRMVNNSARWGIFNKWCIFIILFFFYKDCFCLSLVWLFFVPVINHVPQNTVTYTSFSLDS